MIRCSLVFLIAFRYVVCTRCHNYHGLIAPWGRLLILCVPRMSRNSWMDRMPRLFLRYDRLGDGAILSIVDNIFSNNNLEYALVRWHHLSAVCHVLILEYDIVECRGVIFVFISSCLILGCSKQPRFLEAYYKIWLYLFIESEKINNVL